jgi:hypothetical protein
MKTLNSNLTTDMFLEFELSIEEMVYVRGGATEGEVKTIIPPVIL